MYSFKFLGASNEWLKHVSQLPKRPMCFLQ